MPQQPDPRFIPDEQQDERFIPDTPESSGLSKVWDFATTPLATFPSELGKQFSDWYTEPTLANSPTGKGGWLDKEAEIRARMRGMLGGAVEGLGNLASEFTSPLNLATMGTFGAESAAVKRGLPEIARGLGYAGKALSAPFAAHGGYKTLAPESTLAERGMGLAELAGGMAGMMHTPTAARRGPEALESPALEPKLPLRPSVNPEIAKPLATTGAPPSTEFSDITGPGGLSIDLSSPEGVQSAYSQGRVTKEQALKHLNKYYREQLKNAKSKFSTVDGIQAAYAAGEIDQSTALSHLKRLHQEEIAGAKTTKPITPAPVSTTPTLTEPLLPFEEAVSTPAKTVPREEPAVAAHYNEIPRVEPTSYIIPKNRINKEFIATAKEKGYKFSGLTDKGDFRFKKIKPTTPIEEPTTEPMSRIINEETGESEFTGTTVIDMGDKGTYVIPKNRMEYEYITNAKRAQEGRPPLEGSMELTPEQQQILYKRFFERKQILGEAPPPEYKTEEAPFPLTTEAGPAVPKPAGVQEVIDLMDKGDLENVADLQKRLGISFNRTKVLWYDAKKQIAERNAALGLTDAEVAELSPSKQLPTPEGVGEVIKAIPKTGNEELDNMVRALRAMRRRKALAPFTEVEKKGYLGLMDSIKNHPSLPNGLKKLWNTIEPPKPEGLVERLKNEKGELVIRQENKPQIQRLRTGLGQVYNDGRVKFQDTAGENPFYTQHWENKEWRTDPFASNRFRYKNGEIIWNETPSVEDMFRVEDYIENQGMRVTGHTRWDGTPVNQDAFLRQMITGKESQQGLASRLKNEKGELVIRQESETPTKKNVLGGIEPGRVIIVKSEQATPANVKLLYDEGFRFIGENDKGGLRFKKSAPTGQAPILESEVGSIRPTKRSIQGQLGPIQDAQKSSIVMEAFNLPRGIMASADFSAPLRQGLPLIHKKAFWTAMEPMFKSWASEEGFQASQNSIANRPLFKRRIDEAGKTIPSFADDAGLKLTDLTDLTKREEAIMSTWAEKVPLVRASNRAYTAFLNNLRADVFESLIKDGKILVDVEHNLPLARSIADFVNTASGRGSLGKLEASAAILNTGLFAPRLIASRVKMLNPHYYIMAPPLVRKEALKSLFAVAAFGNTVLQVAKMAGAEVETDPTSSDFGKAKIGNTRIDPWGGFQQYVVAANRLIRPNFARVPGMGEGSDTGIVPLDLSTGFASQGGWRTKSSTTGKEYDLLNPKGPYGQTPADIGGRFLLGKMNPVLGFAWSLATGGKEMSGQKMNFTTMNPMENAIMQRFIPILMQDVYQLAQENPELLPLAIPATFGMGMQTYGSIKQ